MTWWVSSIAVWDQFSGHSIDSPSSSMSFGSFIFSESELENMFKFEWMCVYQCTLCLPTCVEYKAEWHSLWFRRSVDLDQTRSVSLSKIIIDYQLLCLCGEVPVPLGEEEVISVPKACCRRRGTQQMPSPSLTTSLIETHAKQLDLGRWRTCKMVSADMRACHSLSLFRVLRSMLTFLHLLGLFKSFKWRAGRASRRKVHRTGGEKDQTKRNSGGPGGPMSAHVEPRSCTHERLQR
jgi:hypothetical protein